MIFVQAERWGRNIDPVAGIPQSIGHVCMVFRIGRIEEHTCLETCVEVAGTDDAHRSTFPVEADLGSGSREQRMEQRAVDRFGEVQKVCCGLDHGMGDTVDPEVGKKDGLWGDWGILCS